MMSDNIQNKLLSKIREELSSLAMYVDGAKKGIENLENAVTISSEKFPEASRHLNAITGDLEDAANNIMNILEGLIEDGEKTHKLIAEAERFAEALGGDAKAAFAAKMKEIDSLNSRMKTSMTDMFANLSFHDLSGQKVKKVVTALSTVEKKIFELAKDFGFGEHDLGKSKEQHAPAIKQDAVDEIMSKLKG